MNTLKTLRTHWKKTVFAVCVSAYGANYLKGKYEFVLIIFLIIKLSIRVFYKPIHLIQTCFGNFCILSQRINKELVLNGL